MRQETNIEHEAEEPGWFYTDAISDTAVEFLAEHDEQRGDDPFFLFLAYTAPHWPLHALADDIATYAGRFDAGGTSSARSGSSGWSRRASSTPRGR